MIAYFTPPPGGIKIFGGQYLPPQSQQRDPLYPVRKITARRIFLNTHARCESLVIVVDDVFNESPPGR